MWKLLIFLCLIKENSCEKETFCEQTKFLNLFQLEEVVYIQAMNSFWKWNGTQVPVADKRLKQLFSFNLPEDFYLIDDYLSDGFNGFFLTKAFGGVVNIGLLSSAMSDYTVVFEKHNQWSYKVIGGFIARSPEQMSLGYHVPPALLNFAYSLKGMTHKAFLFTDECLLVSFVTHMKSKNPYGLI